MAMFNSKLFVYQRVRPSKPRWVRLEMGYPPSHGHLIGT